MHISLYYKKAILFTASSLFATSAAQAQTTTSLPSEETSATSESGNDGPPEIVVTAQKRSERLSDVPMSISAASGEQLEQRGITSVADLGKIAPGFTYQPSDYGSPVYTIRGVGFKDISVAVAPAVSVYVDQVPLPYSSMTLGANLDLERVEVLKGPQGTLFGQNSTGGAINFIAAKPTTYFSAGAQASYGGFNEISGEGFLSGPLSEDIQARIAIRTEQRDGWQRSQTRDDTLGSRDFTTARLILDVQPSDRLKLEFNVNGWIDRSENQAAQFVRFAPAVPNGYPDLVPAIQAYNPAPDNARVADWDPQTDFRRDDWFAQGSMRADLDLTDSTTLTSITAYSHYKQDSPIDPDGVAVNDFLLTIRSKITSFSQEVRLSGSANAESLRWMIGGNFQSDVSHDNQSGQYAGTSSGIGPVRFDSFINSSNQNVKTYSGFASLDAKLSDRLGAQASVRYTKSNNDFTGCLYDDGDGKLAAAFSLLATSPISASSCVTIDPTTFEAMPIVANSLNEDNLSWKLGVTYKSGRDSLLYANVTKGFKAGSFPTVPAFTPDQFDPVPQESVLAYELGIKQSLLGRRMQVTGALFYYDYRRKQLVGYVDGAFGQVPALISIPRSDVLGAEAGLSVEPLTGLRLSANGIYLRTRVRDSFQATDPFAQLVDLKGEQFPNSPKWQYTLDGEYAFPVANGITAFAGANYSYKSESVASFGNSPEFRLPAYGLLDLRIGVSGEKWRASLWAKNVTNAFYLQSVTHVIDTVARITGMPVTYGATVSYRF
ncbi:MAG: TonB-dependent receptor [Tsuneonella suprasediminis]|nr:TonB-dependent receptor [Altererythrobacter sp. N1]